MLEQKKIIRLRASPQGFGLTPDELSPDMFSSDLPVQHSHEYYQDDALGLYVGVWDTTDMIEAAGPYACDEFMWLLEGEAAIENCTSGRVDTVQSGQAFVIPRGYDCQWRQAGYLRKFYVIYESPHELMPEIPVVEGIVVPASDAPGESAQTTGFPQIFSGATDQEQQICYENGPGSFLVGTWQGGPFESTTRPFPYHLFVCVVAGSLALIEESGEESLFCKGDALFIPSGMNCRARSAEKVNMIFCLVKSTDPVI